MAAAVALHGVVDKGGQARAALDGIVDVEHEFRRDAQPHLVADLEDGELLMTGAVSCREILGIRHGFFPQLNLIGAVLRDVLLATVKVLANAPTANLLSSDTVVAIANAAIGAVATHPEIWDSGGNNPWLGQLVSSVLTTLSNTGVQNTLSTTSSAPARCAIPAIAPMSEISVSGFDGVSRNSSRVLLLTACRHSSTRVGAT